jgi:hypothetical protein
MITREQAVGFPLGKTLYHISEKNADGSPVRVRVTGKCKTWKTKPAWRLPVKYGLRHSFYITPENNHRWRETETETD